MSERVIERAERLLDEGVITMPEYKEVVAGDARFPIEVMRSERDDRKLGVFRASAVLEDAVPTVLPGHEEPIEMVDEKERQSVRLGGLSDALSDTRFSVEREREATSKEAREPTPAFETIDDVHVHFASPHRSAPPSPVSGNAPVLEANLVVAKRIGGGLLLTPPRKRSAANLWASQHTRSRSTAPRFSLGSVFRGVTRRQLSSKKSSSDDSGGLLSPTGGGGPTGMFEATSEATTPAAKPKRRPPPPPSTARRRGGGGLDSRMSEQPFSPADFERRRRVGRGGFGTVYLVRMKLEPHKGRYFAMKVLRKDVVLESGGEARAKLERDVLRVVRHTFIARLRYAFQTETRLYLVTDFYAGGSLKAMLRATIPETNGRCDVAAMRFYAAELALALGYLHGKNIVHRDIKPSNVLVNRYGHVALCDFGIAAVSDVAKPRKRRSFAGTIEYMAPELLRKDVAGYTTAVDFWALGVLCYELVTGATPFYSKLPRELFLNILRAEPKFDAQVWQQTPARFLQGLLEREVANRLDSADAVKSHPFFAGLDFDDAPNLDPPHVPVLPKYFSFADDGALVCTENSKLPKLDDDGESDQDDDAAAAAHHPDNRRAGPHQQQQQQRGLDMHTPAADVHLQRTRRTPSSCNSNVFKGFAYAGDTVVLDRPATAAP
ncbi:hypothetical protein CTAYLR_010771 [Chrysophaeum taylorii]|uniref:Protein kinase domain-containing protein n=1 Tax=Chrysophaeum taylorii TaxID=2483200 RepID=A0AAD7XKS2_9STRA|nr:hypothetical protein CTAYLR_010771 [Chrysophaeum taylorii]